jgi:hypothetical protein
MLGGFDAGPGAFDHIASTDVLRTSLLWLTPGHLIATVIRAFS